MKQTKANIFVKGIPPSFNNKMFFEMFRPFGDIFSSKLPQNSNGSAKGYGYVQYKDQSAAEAAIKEMNNKEVDGKRLAVSIYNPDKKKEKSQNKFTNVFVKNLPPNLTTKEQLVLLFQEFGKITSAAISQKELGGKVGFYGFVNFENMEQANKAVTEMNNKVIDNVPLFVTKALSKEEREKEKIKKRIEQRMQSKKFTLYVKSASTEPLSEKVIQEELMPFGEIKQINVQRTKNTEGLEVNGVIAFVVFSKEEEASHAVKDYKKEGPITVSLLEGREQRKEKLQQERGMPNYMTDFSSMPGSMYPRGMDPFPQMRGFPRPQFRPPGRGGRGRGMPRQRMPGQFREMMPQMDPRQMMYMQPNYSRMPMMPPMNMPGNMPMQMMAPQVPGGMPGMMPPQGMMPMTQQNLMAMQGMIRLPEQMQGMVPGQIPMQMPPPQMQMHITLPTDREELGEIIYTKIMQMTRNE